jgi:hypothetical protein
MKSSIYAILAFTMRAQGFLRGPQFVITFGNLTESNCEDPNINGIKPKAYWNLRRNITAFPVQKTIATMADLGILEDDYIITATKPFYAIILDHEASDVKVEDPGAGYGPKKVTASIFIKGSKADIDGWISAMSLEPDLVFVLEQSDGVRRPIGNADFPARLSAKFDSKSVGSTDSRGWEVEVSSYSIYSERLAADVAVPLS